MLCSWSARLRIGGVGRDVLNDGGADSQLGVGPLRCAYGAAAVVVAGLWADRELRGVWRRGLVAVRGFADAAGVLRCRDRHREGNDGSNQREEQQEFGGQSLHGFRLEQKPE